MPTAGTIDHTGVTSGCITCHSVVDAPTVVEPATHAAHDPSWACNLCHGTSLVAPLPVTEIRGMAIGGTN